jgi:signal peptidase I
MPRSLRRWRRLGGLRRLRPEGSPSRARRAVGVALDMVLVAAVVAAAYALWPASLGGASRIIVVEGRSMEPTYQLGDLLVVRTDTSPDVGDVMVFRIPADEPGGGSLVVHRLVGRRDDGSWIAQGDNRTTPDPFRITERDLVGSPVVSVPRGGRLIGLASRPTSVGLAAGLVAMALLWPSAPVRPVVRQASDDVDDEAHIPTVSV